MFRIHPTRTRRAFTLVELLAVIAIIGVLATLMFVGMGMVRERSDAAVCMSNMRMIGQAVLMNANDNKGRFPALTVGDGFVAMSDSVMPYIDGDTAIFSKKFAAAKRVMCCPSMRKTMLALTGKASVDEFSIQQIRNFGFNANLGPTPSQPNNWRTVASIVNPSRTMMLTEAGITPAPPHNNVGSLDGYWLVQSTMDENKNLRKGVHTGANNIVWCDGHVTRWEDVNRLLATPYNSTGPLNAWTGR